MQLSFTRPYERAICKDGISALSLKRTLEIGSSRSHLQNSAGLRLDAGPDALENAVVAGLPTLCLVLQDRRHARG